MVNPPRQDPGIQIKADKIMIKTGPFLGMLKTLASAEVIAQNSKGIRVHSRLGFAQRYLSSYYRSRKHLHDFDTIRNYCLFIGHARSGGTLLGALIDAHPNSVIGDEVEIFQYIQAGFSREQVFQLLLDRSAFQAEKGKTKSGRDNQTYTYRVAGGWQGRHEKLLVVGNRKAGITTQRLSENFLLLDQTKRLMADIPIRAICSIRNPYDTISTNNLRGSKSLEEGIAQYFTNCEIIERVRKELLPANVLILKHEDLVRSPETQLQKVCKFLDLNPYKTYLKECARVVYKKPSVTRHKAQWDEDLILRVKEKIGKYDFLNGYTFESS